MVKYKGFGLEYVEFEVLAWAVWSLGERTSSEPPALKPGITS